MTNKTKLENASDDATHFSDFHVQSITFPTPEDITALYGSYYVHDDREVLNFIACEAEKGQRLEKKRAPPAPPCVDVSDSCSSESTRFSRVMRNLQQNLDGRRWQLKGGETKRRRTSVQRYTTQQ